MNLRELSEVLDCAVNGGPPETDVERVKLAQDLLKGAIGLLKEVENDGNFGAQLIARLELLATKNHQYLSSDSNLDVWINELEEDPPEDNEDE